MVKSKLENQLSGQQIRFLKAKAHPLKPIVLVGESGLTEGVINSVKTALLAHELIKVKMHDPENKKAMAQKLANMSQAHLCGLIGHTVILYKTHPEKPRNSLPH